MSAGAAARAIAVILLSSICATRADRGADSQSAAPRLVSALPLSTALGWGTRRHSHHPRVKRSATAKHQFQRAHPCPSTGNKTGHCPGYVIDHVKPLACSGTDKPANMQWQTTAEAKAKDKWERAGCGGGRR